MDNGHDREEAIRTRAHEIWEREGRQDGFHEDHWHRAAHELASEQGASSEDEDNTGIMSEALDIPQGGTPPSSGQSSAASSTQTRGSEFVTSLTAGGGRTG